MTGIFTSQRAYEDPEGISPRSPRNLEAPAGRLVLALEA
jgi:hypothetical protein